MHAQLSMNWQTKGGSRFYALSIAWSVLGMEKPHYLITGNRALMDPELVRVLGCVMTGRLEMTPLRDLLLKVNGAQNVYGVILAGHYLAEVWILYKNFFSLNK